MRCERSEHGKSQLSIKFLCTIFTLILFLPFIHHFQISLSLSATLCLFASQSHYAVRRLQVTSQRLCEVAASLNFLRGSNVQICTKLSAGLLPPSRKTARCKQASWYFGKNLSKKPLFNIYSALIASIGLAVAARHDCQLTVARTTTDVASPATTNTHQSRLVLYEKFCSQ